MGLLLYIFGFMGFVYFAGWIAVGIFAFVDMVKRDARDGKGGRQAKNQSPRWEHRFFPPTPKH